MLSSVSATRPQAPASATWSAVSPLLFGTEGDALQSSRRHTASYGRGAQCPVIYGGGKAAHLFAVGRREPQRRASVEILRILEFGQRLHEQQHAQHIAVAPGGGDVQCRVARRGSDGGLLALLLEQLLHMPMIAAGDGAQEARLVARHGHGHAPHRGTERRRLRTHGRHSTRRRWTNSGVLIVPRMSNVAGVI